MRTRGAIHRGVVRGELDKSHCFLPFLTQHGRQEDLKQKCPCQTCLASLMTFSAEKVTKYLLERLFQGFFKNVFTLVNL